MTVGVDITDKLGYTLLKKGVVDYETLDRALKIKEQEDSKTRRSLAQILVSDFGIDHDSVFKEVANLYGFREIYLADENIDKNRIDFIKKLVEPLPQALKEQMRSEKILPLKYDEQRPDKLILISADPTSRAIPLIARALGAKRYEVCYVRLKDMQNLFDKVFPPENEFFKSS